MKAQLLAVYCLGLALAATTSYAQECNSDVTPADNPLIGYRFRTNRCEGTLDISIAAPRMVLVNFTKGRASYALRHSAVIKLKSLTTEFETVNVRGIPVPLAVPYRMDATLKANDTLQWQTAEVIDEIGLTAQNLGIFGWVGPDATKTYVPVDMMQSNTDLLLILRASKDLQLVKWRLAKMVQGNTEPFGPYTTVAGQFIAHDPIVIRFNQASVKGSYLLEVLSTSIGAPQHVGQFKILVP